MRQKYVTDAIGVKNLATFLKGAASHTAALEAAAVGGGTIQIPEGTYFLDDADLPATADITLEPIGNVIFTWNAVTSIGAGAALRFNNTANWGADVSVTAVADEDNYPTASEQRISKISGAVGAFSAFAFGDVCHLMSDDTSFDGYIKAEMFRVNYVAADGSYILASRKLFYAYTAGVNTTIVRRATATPKLTIKKGITFQPAQDPSGVHASRSYGLYIMAAVEPDIDVEFDGAYVQAVYDLSTYGGTIKVRARNLHVNYAQNAFGYVTSTYGAAFGTTYDIFGDDTGHLSGPTASQTTYTPSLWWQAGVPQSCVFRVEAVNCRSAAADSHWSIRPRFEKVIIHNAGANATSPTQTVTALFIGAIDPYFGEVICHGSVRALLSLRDHKGIPTHFVIASVDYRTDGTPTACPLIVAATQTGSVPPIVEIQSGFVETPGQYLLNNMGNGTDSGFRVIINKGVTFGSCLGLVRYAGTRDMFVDLSGTWQAEGNTGTNGVVNYDVSQVDMLTIWDLDIVRGATYPDGIIRGEAAATACTTKVGRVRVHNGAIPWTTSGSSALSIQTLTRIGQQDELTSAPTSTTASTVTVGTRRVRLSHTSGTPTVTIPAAAQMLGCTLTIVHMALGGGTATIAPSAGTIIGGASTTIASAAYATYLAHGTDWVRIG